MTKNSEVEMNSQLNERVLKNTFQKMGKKKDRSVRTKIHENRKGVRRYRSSVVLSSTFGREMLEIPGRGLYCNRVKRYSRYRWSSE